MTQRLACCVPFCRRTFKDDGSSEIICGNHWRAVSTHLRRRKYKLYRRYRYLYGDNGYWAFPAGSPKRIAAVKLARLCDAAWMRCKRQAIERAAGI
ncbi:hypothetical protein [Mesorhizobium sp. LNJC384A00]|uniref:hypothetical protein n=1 Tax=unclassified Mesorhizobium TaxID=325217 RepID=UPI0009FE9F8E|nr:hypothetical protein [Mesorhizobium sp. LNJC384A00]